MTHHAGNRPSCILALDTACGEIAACVICNGHSHASEQDENENGKTRSMRIAQILNALLDQAGLTWKQLDGLALGAGPGSFTGLRIGAATLAGINADLHLPIVHLSSLAITARQINTGQQNDTPAAVRVLEDARAGEVFSGYYQSGMMLEADICLRWEQVQALTPGQFCCHCEPPTSLNDWARLPLTLPRSRALIQEAQAACAQVSDWQELPVYPSPAYLQLSQAERQAHGS